MSRVYPRTLRVGEQIHRELAELIRRDLRDPMLGMVTLAEVDVAPDFAHAKVYFTVIGNEPDEKKQIETSTAALARAAGFLRRELGKRLRLRSIPQLRFIYDESERRAARLESLLADERRRQGGDDQP